MRARFLAIAKEHNQTFNLILTRYAIERFLCRLSASRFRNRFSLMPDSERPEEAQPCSITRALKGELGVTPKLWANRKSCFPAYHQCFDVVPQYFKTFDKHPRHGTN